MASENWTILSSEKEVKKYVANEEKDKLIVIIFNLSTVSRFDPELALKKERQHYESSNVKFFKCNIIDVDAELPTAFKVTDVPTYIFYREGKERDRLQEPKKEDLFAKLDELVKQK